MPLLIAHRGAMNEAPENTKEAFDKAISYPIGGFELDVQITSDGIPVIFHDKFLRKINRTFKTISDYKYQELYNFDWGSWYSADYQKAKILTLEQLLILYGTKTKLFIEIKAAPHRKKIPLYSELPKLVTKLIRQFTPSELINNIYVLSFDPDLLKRAYSDDDGLNYVLNLNSPVFKRSDLKIDLDVLYGCCLEFKKLTPEFIAFCHHEGKKIMTYSCNTHKKIDKAFSLQVDVIMADDPGSVYKYFLKKIKKNIDYPCIVDHECYTDNLT